MKNVVGPPAEGDDFFNRDRDLKRFRRLIENGSLLLIAPRRVGKTSFVLNLCQSLRASGCAATLFSAEGCPMS